MGSPADGKDITKKYEGPEHRSTGEVVTELASLSTLFTLVAALVTSHSVGTGNWGDYLKWIKTTGPELLGQLGWSLGAYVAVLVAFYIAVVAEQVVGDGGPVPTRRLLGQAAVVMAAMIVPAVLLVGLYCLNDPAKLVVMFVVLPIAGIIMFLAIQLGRYIVFERELRRAWAREARSLAQRQLASIGEYSARPVYLVVLANAGAAMAAFAISDVALYPPFTTTRLLAAFAICGVTFTLALLLLTVNLRAVSRFRTATGTLAKAGVLMWPALWNIASSGLVLTFITNLPLRAAPTVLFPWIVTLAGSFVRWSATNRRCAFDWSIRGAALRHAYQTAERRFQSATDELKKLQSTSSRHSLWINRRRNAPRSARRVRRSH